MNLDEMFRGWSEEELLCPGTCAEHGDFTDQQINIRAYSGLKPFAMPYWLGCPECRRLAEAANKLEAQRWAKGNGLIPGTPEWSR